MRIGKRKVCEHVPVMASVPHLPVSSMQMWGLEGCVTLPLVVLGKAVLLLL